MQEQGYKCDNQRRFTGMHQSAESKNSTFVDQDCSRAHKKRTKTLLNQINGNFKVFGTCTIYAYIEFTVHRYFLDYSCICEVQWQITR